MAHPNQGMNPGAAPVSGKSWKYHAISGLKSHHSIEVKPALNLVPLDSKRKGRKEFLRSEK